MRREVTSRQGRQAHDHTTVWAETTHGRVVGVRRLGEFAVLEVAAAAVAAVAGAGQFVMVTVPDAAALLRRPLSLFRIGSDTVSLLVEVRGRGTRALASLEVGDPVDLAGPLGTGFPTAGVRSALLVGGGVGCAPLQALADALASGGAQVTAAFGFRDHRQARLAGAFDLTRLWLTTEDGSVGRRGTVVDLLEHVDAPPHTTLYVCGPPAMIGAARRWALSRRLGGFASLEAHMACGTGSCHGCVVQTTRGYLRVCSEGPVFPLEEVAAT